MKKIILAAAAVLTCALVFAFDWPQNEISSDTFFSYFAQDRGGTISSSLVFSETHEVKAAGQGRVLAVLTDNSGGDFFESTLGNAVIISHDDNMMTVYANLDDSNEKERFKMRDVNSGTYLGKTGSSGWQMGEGCLEFQVVDLKNESFINPRILMPRSGDELELSIRNVTAINKKGERYNLGFQKNLDSGIYRLYRESQDIAMPFKTIVYVNGASVETLTYDVLLEKDGKIVTGGRTNYAVEDCYPESGLQLLGEVTIPKGKNEISVVVSDINGQEKSIVYSIEAR